jgi:uncharacterized iron-regulated protein
MRRLRLTFLSVLLTVSAGELPAQEPPLVPQRSPTFLEWQILETATGRSLNFEDWIGTLSNKDVIYVGEEHHNRFHVTAAVKILEALITQGRRPALALEMFSWDAQPAINRYLSGQTPLQAFLEAVHWEQTWGGAYDDYAPLINFAREHQLKLLALNPPRSLVRRVVAVGLAQTLREPETLAWGMTQEIPDDRSYADLISKQITLCHPGMSEQGYQRMLEASQFRDEGMAKIITDYLQDRRPEQGPLLSYTGGGHIQYQVPVPKRVVRRHGGLAQTTIYLASFDGNRSPDLQGLLQDVIADYVWLTPLSAHGAPRRCGS